MNEYYVQANQFLAEKCVEDRQRTLSENQPVIQFQRDSHEPHQKNTFLRVVRQLATALIPGTSSV